MMKSRSANLPVLGNLRGSDDLILVQRRETAGRAQGFCAFFHAVQVFGFPGRFCAFVPAFDKKEINGHCSGDNKEQKQQIP